MSTHKEVELKLRYFQEELWEKISLEPIIVKMLLHGSKRQMFLETIYYDTPSYSLKKAGLSYRIRHQEEEWIATVKADGVTSGGLHDRSEWSFVINNPEPDITPFYELPVGERMKNSLGQEGLREILRTRFKRKSVDLRTPEGGLVELAVDWGEIVVDEKTTPIQEIELELKDGNVADVLLIAAELARNYVLLPEGDSKFHRGLVLAKLSTTEEKKAADSFIISPNEEAGAAIDKVLLFYVQEITEALEKSVKETDTIRVLNQFRDKLQNLKRVLSFSKSLINTKGNNEVLQRIEKMAEEVSHRRDIDISKGEYVPVVFEFWAWLLKNHWDEQKDIMTIREYTVKWVGAKSFDSDIVEMEHILEEFQSAITRDLLE
ncbi:MAG: hypothetical protein CVU87_03040 [Firmicutes bacterium HGW-Firmicutes-12]|nr:MAG: hypothetical protein CVU87_03040 [Firmicutes bacterium HGW-Firmicutes-12]